MTVVGPSDGTLGNYQLHDKFTGRHTKREQLRVNAALERDEANKQFALNVLNHLPKDTRYEAASRLAEVAEYVITPSAMNLRRLATDQRVTGVEIVEPGARLPSSGETRPHRRIKLEDT